MQVTKPVYVRKADRLVPVRCPVCGVSRPLSDRRARAIRQTGHETTCHACRYPVVVRDQDRLWWLRNFDDATIAEIAVGLFGIGDAEAVRSWREKLLPGGRQRRKQRQAPVSLWDRLDTSTPPGPEPQVGEVRFAEWVEAEAAVGLLSDEEALAALAEHGRVRDLEPASPSSG